MPSELWSEIRDLEIRVEDVVLEPRVQNLSGWERTTTLVRLRGDGLEGRGEDVGYRAEAHERLLARATGFRITGRMTLEAWSHRLDTIPAYVDRPLESFEPLYRRWAFEAAALDLALARAGRTLADVVGRVPAPVAFVASTGLGSPPSTAGLEHRLERDPALRFKVDFSNAWTPELVDRLAALDRVVIVDFKGRYREHYQGPRADGHLYRVVAERLPDAWLEDPDLTDPGAARALDPFMDRVTWDAPIHAIADVDRLGHAPQRLNVKPSRFGRLSELFRFYAACSSRGIELYGGGQAESPTGRAQIQMLASLFHPESRNDVAPCVYNTDALDGLPESPLEVEAFSSAFDDA